MTAEEKKAEMARLEELISTDEELNEEQRATYLKRCEELKHELSNEGFKFLDGKSKDSFIPLE